MKLFIKGSFSNKYRAIVAEALKCLPFFYAGSFTVKGIKKGCY